jgi:hypothetical protein
MQPDIGLVHADNVQVSQRMRVRTLSKLGQVSQWQNSSALKKVHQRSEIVAARRQRAVPVQTRCEWFRWRRYDEATGRVERRVAQRKIFSDGMRSD